jgi:hypothetical protein
MRDEHGKVLSPAALGMPGDHPTTTEVIVELEDIDGCTTTVPTMPLFPRAPQVAAGWTMALNNLVRYINAQSLR